MFQPCPQILKDDPDSLSTKNFETGIIDFKDNRDRVLSILKFVIEQNRIEPFLSFLSAKESENKTKMKEFIKSKYYDFVESMDHIKDCKNTVHLTDEVLTEGETSIQEFLLDFNENFIERIRKKEQLKNLISEKEKLSTTYIFFAYINKAHLSVESQQFEQGIQLMNYAFNKFLRKFPTSSYVFIKGDELITNLKTKITTTLQQKLAKWLIDINKEQSRIGESLFYKIKNQFVKTVKNEFSSVSNDSSSNNNTGKQGHGPSIRTTKNIVDSGLLIRNTSNLNYMLNKNSVGKTSIVGGAGNYNEEVEFDIINMVSNVDLKFLEQAHAVYKSVDVDSKFLDYFRSFRQSQLHTLLKLDKALTGNQILLYDNFFSEILGFIIIQMAVFEIYPFFYTKRKFDENMNYLIKELQNILSFEFDTFTKTTEFITLERSIIHFINSIERIGISEKIGIDIRSLIVEMTKSKVMTLNILLISQYNTVYSRMILDDLNSTGGIVKNEKEYEKLATQYSITPEETKFDLKGIIYPYKLPYTQFVIDVNENFKKYVDELFEFIRPGYSDYDGIVPEMVRDFLKKGNEVFIFFANGQEQDINVISLAQICNNIRYILQSHVFYVDYVKTICCIKSYISIYSERPLKEAWLSYDEMIYEQLKKLIRRFLSDLTGDNWMPTSFRNGASSYVDGLIAYLNVIYINLQTLSHYYIESCFKDAIKFTSKLFAEIIFDDAVIKNYNFYAIANGRNDIEAGDDYYKGIDLSLKDFFDALAPVKNFLDVFETKKIEVFYENNKNLDSFYKGNEIDCLKFLQKYKNIKSSKEMKGKINESEVNSMVKKMKSLLGIK